MANEQLQQLIKNGLAAMKAGSEMAAQATDAINNAARNPKLKAALEKGNETAKMWAERVERALQEAGESEKRDNPVIEGVSKVSKEILESAPDDYSRDLGIIASGQLALHYWIAAFGTMRSYTSQVKLDQAEKEMKACLDEAKQQDEEYTEIAKEIMSQK